MSNNDFQTMPFNFHLTIHANRTKEVRFRNMNFKECNGTLNIEVIRRLEITNWNCTVLNPRFLVTLQSLEYLIFSAVKLRRNVEIMNIFANLTRLKYIDITCNEITDFHTDFFESQTESLQTLILANNLLRHVPRSIFALKYLQHVDLRMNLISREKGRDLTQSCDKSPYTNRNVLQMKPLSSWTKTVGCHYYLVLMICIAPVVSYDSYIG